nr:RHS repeat protein [Pectobacterium odoriferum]
MGCCAFIKRGDAQGLQVAPQFMDILRGDDNAAGHDADVQVRRWEYDGVRESPSKVVYEDGSETQFGYDVEGNLTAITDALGQRSPFRYGAFDNLLEATCAITTMRKRSSPGVKNN